jgi:hypothetical protein
VVLLQFCWLGWELLCSALVVAAGPPELIETAPVNSRRLSRFVVRELAELVEPHLMRIRIPQSWHWGVPASSL